MTKFPLFPVPFDKFTVACAVFAAVLGAVTLIGRPPITNEAPVAAPSQHALAAVPPAVASAASRAVAPPPAPPRFTVRTVDGQPTFADAATLAGLSASAADRVADALRGRIDFRRGWQPGNRVSFVFDTKAHGDADARPPAMPAAVRVMTSAGRHDIFLYRNLHGKAFYYTKDGERARGGFLRYPLRFTRVSSRFSRHRFDPVLKRWRAHEGVDFAAPVGTPVHATGNGVVTFAGRQTGYGNVIEIRNRAPYSTLFAHLSRFAKGVRVGTRVRRNQVIGYVGATGWATGPHLHYEVHVDDVPKNPLTVSLPPAEPLHGRELSRFASRSEKLEDLL